MVIQLEALPCRLRQDLVSGVGPKNAGLTAMDETTVQSGGSDVGKRTPGSIAHILECNRAIARMMMNSIRSLSKILFN